MSQLRLLAEHVRLDYEAIMGYYIFAKAHWRHRLALAQNEAGGRAGGFTIGRSQSAICILVWKDEPS
jgi:hypothetical protein